MSSLERSGNCSPNISPAKNNHKVEVTHRFFPVCDPVREFECKNGLCIPAADRCNQYEECPAGEDEEGCEGMLISRFFVQ